MSASEPAHEEAAVRGERSAALVNAARSMQARVSNILAAALMIALGVGALTWYYAHALTRQSHARAAAQSTVQSRAQGEMPLPPLGRIVPPASSPYPRRCRRRRKRRCLRHPRRSASPPRPTRQRAPHLR